MRSILYHWLVRLLILSVLAGALPLPGSQVSAQSASKKQSAKKKKRVPKKSSSKRKTPSRKKKRRPATKKKKGQAKRSKRIKGKSKKVRKRRPTRRKKPAGKKRPSKEQRPGTKESRKQAPESTPSPTLPKEKVSAIELSNELYDMTESLTASSRRLARATSYLQPFDRKKVIRIESRPVYSIEELEQAARKEPENIRLQRELALQYETQHDWEDAKDIYLRLIAKDPLNPDFHYYLGSLYASMGELVKARQAFEEALDIQPDHKATLDAMASFMGSRDKRQISEEVLLRSSLKDPQGPAQRLAIIRDKIQEGDYKAAIRLADEAIERYPDRSGYVYLKGVAYEESGETDKAKAAYQQAIKMDPKNREAHLALANLYYSQGKYIYAALAYSDAVYLDPMDIETRYMQGLCYFNAREWGRAAAAWEDLLHYDPNHPLARTLLPQTYYILAVEYNRSGKSVLGKTAFEKALSINPNTNAWLPGSLRTLGKYYREKGMYKESLAAFQETVELRPNDAAAYLEMGVTYWKMDERQLARGAWERSLELNPDNNEARGWLIISQQDS